MKSKEPTEVSSDYNKLSNPTNNTITINADTTATASVARLRKSRLQRIQIRI